MILTALYEYARREELLENLDYEQRPISYILRYAAQGRFIGLEPCFSTDEKGKLHPLPMPVPRGDKRTSGIAPYFLSDKTDYVFAWPDPDPKKKANRNRLNAQHRAFVKLHEDAYDATGDEALEALLAFFKRFDSGETTVEMPEDRPKGANIVFIYDPDGARRVHDRPAIKTYWEEQRHRSPKGKTSTCLITGEQAPPEAVHPAVKNLAGANPAGCGLVSFNFEAACSFGKKQNHNAPVGRKAAEGYTAALNKLLARGGQSIFLDASTVAAFWTREADEMEVCFGGMIDDNPKNAARLYTSPQSGTVSALTRNKANRFYALTLSGAQGRAAVRDWFESSTADVLNAVRNWFEDLKLHFPFETRPRRSLAWLLASTVLEGKKDNIPPNLSSRLYAAILRDAPLPNMLLSMAVVRCRAEGVVPERKQGGFDWNRAYLRTSLIKAYFNRAKRKGLGFKFQEVTEMLDKENTDSAYRLGRLFAVLENLQGHAIGNVNASIADRYYGSASANPATVFPRLLSLSQHHLSKLEEGRRRYFDIQLTETMDGLPAEKFPLTFSMEEQGLFAIGYYHQRADLFRKKEDRQPAGNGENP